MKIKLKKILSGFLAFLLVISVVPSNTLVIAADSEENISSEDTTDTESNVQYEAKIGDVGYATLQAAIEAAEENATIVLQQDVVLQGGHSNDAEAGLYIEKSITLDGNGYTIDCGTFTKGIRLYSVDGTGKAYTFKNMKIVNNNAYGRCIDTRVGNTNLTMNGVTLTAEGTNSQPLTIGGSKRIYKVTIDNCKINAGKSGYGIISFVQTTSGFKINGTEISGFAALYIKEGSNGSVYNIGGNCKLTSTNNHPAASGTFGTIVLEGNNNTVKCTAKTSSIEANADNTATQGVFDIRGTGNKLFISHDVTLSATGNSVLVVGSETGLSNATYYDKFYNFSTELEGTFVPVVVVDKTAFLSFEEGWSHAVDGDTVKLLANVTTSESFVNKQTITLDLNGHTITATDNSEKSFALITNKGNLTITGEGKMTLTAIYNRDWNAYSSVISNTVGGKLTVESGTIEHLGGTDMAYAIDNLTNGKGTYAETIINGGTIKSTYRAIRQFLNGVEALNILTVNGGTIEGTNKSIWFQDPSKNANSGTLSVGENAVLNGDVYLYVTAGSTEWPVNVSIAASALAEGSNVVTGNIPEQYGVENVDGVYGNVSYAALIGEVGYKTFADAWAAAKDGDTVKMLTDLTVDTETFNVAEGVSITLNMNSKKIAVSDNSTKNYELFYIYGDLTVIGNGTIELTASNNRAWNASSSIFHNRGGVLNLENGTFTHKGGTDMAYVVDNSGNYYGDATTNIKGGALNSTYIAIRNRMEQNSHGASGTAYLNVSGGIITGVKRAIWAQAASTSTTAPATGEINISGGEINGLIQTPAGNGSQCLTTISGGTVEAFQGEYGELTVTGDGKVESTTLLAVDGQKAVVHIGKVGYSSLANAIEAAENGDKIDLLANISLDTSVLQECDGYATIFTINKEVTIDLKGKNLTLDATEQLENDAILMGLFAVDTNGKLTLKDSIGGGLVSATTNGENGAYLYSLVIAYNGLVNIEGGNYEVDYQRNGRGMIYGQVSDHANDDGSNKNKGVNVYGGSFKLGNLAGKSNGSPWIFNTAGSNSGKYIYVAGGSFNADVAHQYYVFEVLMPKEKALKYNAETGMYDTVDAVAYVTEREWSSKWYTNEIGYATLEEAIAACEGSKTKVYYKKTYTSEQEVVVLLTDINLVEKVTIANGKSVVLDLNGKKISGNFTGTGNQEMFLVKGNMTVKNGSMVMFAQKDQGWNAMATIFDVTAGGVLNIEKATIENLGGTSMNFAVHMNNWGEVTLNVEDSVLKATYIPVRIFNSGYDMNNVTIEKSTLEGGSYCLWVHNYIGDLDSSKHSDDAINARLNLNIYGNDNTFTTTKENPVLFGFNTYVYFDADGNKVDNVQ